MLAYIDYPGSREIVTNPLELINRYRSFPGALVSTIVMVGGVDVNEDYFKVWASLTGSRRLIEDAYGEVWSYIKGIADDEDLVSLVMRVYEESSELVDLVALSNALKLFLGLNIYDLGLAIIYENPLMALNGVRMELRTGRALLAKRHRVEDIELNTALVLQPETNRQVVDWGNPGVLPASGAIGDESVSDPAFTILTSGIRFLKEIETPFRQAAQRPAEAWSSGPLRNRSKQVEHPQLYIRLSLHYQVLLRWRRGLSQGTCPQPGQGPASLCSLRQTEAGLREDHRDHSP